MAASSSSPSGEQQYSLRWNDFHSSILNSFRHLRDEEDFVDVTLACDNNRSFTAHKVVLSACSPYFRKLLKANPCQHPIIILRDVPASDMESLLRFMYHGEVHVSQDQLGVFLKTAQLLQVRGLADVNCGTNSKILPPMTSSCNNESAPATPRPWQDNGREDIHSPAEKRPRSYSPALSNHVEPKSDYQESLLGQALEGGPTIHTAPSNNTQAQSTCDDSNSVSDNDEEMSNNESILNSVKAEPSDIMNDLEHRGTFPAALLSLQGNMQGILSGAGPSGIHPPTNDPSYGRWQPSGGDGSSSSSAWLPGTSSTRNEHTGSGTYQSGGGHNSKGQDLSALLQHHQHHHQHHQHHGATSQPLSQQHTLNPLNSLNTEQLTMMHQKLQNNLQSLQQSNAAKSDQLNLMLQSCSKDKIESMAMLHQQTQRRFHQQLDNANHPSGKPKCPECGKIYSNNSNLKQHIVNVHTVQTEYISCYVCNKQFKTKQYLQIHLLSMHGIRKRKSYPLYHMQTHVQAQQPASLQTASQVSAGQQQSQQQYSTVDRWSEEKQ